MKTAKITKEMPVNLNEVTQNNVVFDRRIYSAVLSGKTTNFYCCAMSEKG